MKPVVLIVEDEPAIADTIQYALETEGFDTICLAAGLPVMPLLKERVVDLIVLDIGLPDIGGFELCKKIRRHYRTPVIFLTARADEVDRVVGLEIGGDDYVVKPFSPRELSARVKAVLRRMGDTGSLSSGSSAGGTAPFEIDESRRQIRYFNQNLDLSRYEYDILKTFIRRPGHVFSRERLMDIVWDEPEASMDRTVDAHIKNLRAKLKAIRPGVDPIITHRGAGYALKEIP